MIRKTGRVAFALIASGPEPSELLEIEVTISRYTGLKKGCIGIDSVTLQVVCDDERYAPSPSRSSDNASVVVVWFHGDGSQRDRIVYLESSFCES